MPDRTILDEVAEALNTHQWTTFPRSAHGVHNYYAECAVCQKNTAAMAAVVLRAVAQSLHGLAYETNGPAVGTAGGIRFAAGRISEGLPDVASDAAHTRKDTDHG